MKKALSLFLSVLLLVSALVLPAAAAPAADSYEGKTVIIYTGNVRGDVSVYPRIKAARDAYEAAGADVYLVDTGNYLQGSAAANTDRGAGITDLMSAAGYDFTAMGLAEFSYTDATTGYPYHGNFTRYYTQAQLQSGAEELTYAQNRDGSVTAVLPARDASSFAALSANVEPNTAVYASAVSAVATREGGLTLGFYGLTDPAVEQNVQDADENDVPFVSVRQPRPVEFTESDDMPAPQLIICLSNAGVSGSEYGDIVIDAPTAGSMVMGAYVIDNETLTVTHEELALSNTDETVAALADQVQAAAGEVLFTSEVVLNGSDSLNWNGESNLGDLVTDALVWYAENFIDGIDESLPLVAIQNGGNCDQFIYTGDVTETDLLRALPFSPMGIGVLIITGEQLLETLEAASQCADCPGFAQVSGLSYTLDLGQDYDGGAAYGSYYVADSVNRVTITSVNGQPFDPAARYALVCDNFLMNGSDTYYTLQNIRDAGEGDYINNGTGVRVRDAVAMYVEQQLGGVIGEEYAEPQGRITVLLPSFEDVADGVWYHDAVGWAASRGITTGATETAFDPNALCTRAHILTFLWRAAGQPDSTLENPFTDLSGSEYYYSAALWAYEQGLIEGRAFDADAPCLRSDVVTYLWQLSGSPVLSGQSSFDDVSADAPYAHAVLWAVDSGITTGASETTFEPDGTCTRAEIVTFLYRHFAL